MTAWLKAHELSAFEQRMRAGYGVDVVRVLMAAYRSAELGRTVRFPPAGIDDFVP